MKTAIIHTLRRRYRMEELECNNQLSAMKQTAQDISDHMRQLRKDADMSARGLAREIGISAAYLIDMELNRRRYLEQHVDAVLKILQP